MQIIESHSEKIEQEPQGTTEVRIRASTVHAHVDIGLAVSLVGPPALIGLLMLMGLGFAPAVCVMFTVVFVTTTVQDVTWMRKGRAHVENHGELD